MSAGRTDRVNVVAYDMATALGVGAETCWDALLAGRVALAPDPRFYPSDAARCYPVGAVAACDAPEAEGRSRFMRLVSCLLPAMRGAIPADAKLILATTIGEADMLEASVQEGTTGDCPPLDTLAAVRAALGLARPGLLLSAACASSTAALAAGAEWIASGKEDCVCVLGCDALSEFAYSGFLSLQALSAGLSQPFAAGRDGLNLGEGAGFILLMSDARAHEENRPRFGCVAGWGQSSDAYHATTPDPDGKGLARAIRAAMTRAGIAPADIAAICAHGTGTPFNDAMEECAFAAGFAGRPPPLFGIKGALGHTLGAAGVIEAVVSLLALRDGHIPPTVGNAALPGARIAGAFALTTNSGFGGINAALVLHREEAGA